MAALKSVLKTVTVMEEILRLNKSHIGVSDLAEALGWSRAATHQYLSSLVAAGWLQKTPTKKYELTAQAAVFGRFAVEHAGVPPELSPTMQNLVEELSEPVSFAVLNGNDAVIVERYEPKRPFAINREAERHLRLWHSSSGLVLLAYDPYASKELDAAMDLRVREVRAQGFARIHSEWMGDAVEAVAVPILSNEKCLGALSVIAPYNRLDAEKAIRTLKTARLTVEEQIDNRISKPIID